MKVTVIGAARSGLAAAKLAKRLGNDVFLSESKQTDEFQETIKSLENNAINFEFGGNTKLCLNTELMVVSPGVPPEANIIVEAEKQGIEIISELEFAYRNCKNPIIALTGTNGKTTTTSLITYILNNSGRNAVSAGNIGQALSDFVGTIDEDTVIVIEASSYQLDRVKSFRPEVSMILNISPDHLAYHKTMEQYISAKWKICAKQNSKNLLILNADDEQLSKGRDNSQVETAFFSMSSLDRGIFVKEDSIFFKRSKEHKEEFLMSVNELSLPGVHNTYNSMAAALAARAFEVSNEDIRKSLMTFKGVEHRLEHVRTLNGIDIINDSKATNINATWFALSSYNKPLVWIAGGRGDSNDYSMLDEFVKNNVKCIIAIGEEANAIFNHFCTKKRCIIENDFTAAVQIAYNEADAGDIVLFTPACKSFDMFTSYEHRGKEFKRIVNEL